MPNGHGAVCKLLNVKLERLITDQDGLRHEIERHKAELRDCEAQLFLAQDMERQLNEALSLLSAPRLDA